MCSGFSVSCWLSFSALGFKDVGSRMKGFEG